MHPNVVQVFDYGLDEETRRNFIVMEHVDGHSCAELLKEHGVLDPRDAVDILEQACRGLDYAHRNGVVHRDVKPGNLLRSHEGVVKLADFGIAKAAEDSEITKAGSVLGTAAYLSPEQARGEKAGPAGRPLRARRRLLPAADRPPALRGGLADRPRADAGGRAAAEPQRRRPGRPARRSARRSCARCTRCPRAATRARSRWATRSRDGLRGDRPRADRRHVALDPTSATRMLGDTGATRAQTGTSSRPAQRTRRPSQPLDEPPRRREPARRARRRRRAEPRRAAARKRRNPLRCVVVLVLLLAVAVAGVLAYQTVQDNTNRAVQLRENVRGGVQDAVDEIKGLIEDNTQ